MSVVESKVMVWRDACAAFGLGAVRAAGLAGSCALSECDPATNAQATAATLQIRNNRVTIPRNLIRLFLSPATRRSPQTLTCSTIRLHPRAPQSLQTNPRLPILIL